MSDKELRDVERFARQKGKEAAQPLPPKNRTMIERYTSDDVLDFNPTGEFVYYSDHEAALAAERAKVRELVEALESTVEWIKNPSGSIVGAIAPSAFIPYVESLINNYKEEPNNE